MTIESQSSFAAQIDPVEGRPFTLVSVTGEVNAATAPSLREALDIAVEQGVTVIVDLADVESFDSAGALALDSAARRARLAHGKLAVRNAERIAEWLRQTLPSDGLLELDSGSTGPWVRRPASVSGLQAGA